MRGSCLADHHPLPCRLGGVHCQVPDAGCELGGRTAGGAGPVAPAWPAQCWTSLFASVRGVSRHKPVTREDHRFRKHLAVAQPLRELARTQNLRQDQQECQESQASAVLVLLLSSSYSFSSKPPHGRRHLLMHLQKEPQASGATYVLTLRGDVYSHRKNLKEMGMKSQFMQLDNGRNDFVQSMRITNTEPDKEMIRHLLQQAVSETPIYLMDQTNTTDDTLVQWLQDQPTIYLKGSPKETRTGSNAQRPINEPPASQSQSEPPPY